MISPTYVADLFCGAGGSSTGAEKAIQEIGGRMELVAVNHWPIAVQTHQSNHPTAQHYLQDLDKADPEEIVPNRYLDLLMASPECRYYSRARGGKPVHDQGRMNPWVVHRWLTSLNVKCLIVENVPEFVGWGPLLDDGRPDKTRKGMYFEEWVKSLWGLGYEAEWRMLNAANYGDATTRIRFFLQARNDGKPIRWPEATHSKTGGPSLLCDLPKWRAAQDIIDWSNPGRSLLDDPKYRKKQLSEKTLRRIARGLKRFGGPLAHLYIRLLNLPDDVETAGGNGDKEPFLVSRHDDNGSYRVHSAEGPTPTITTIGTGYLVEPEVQSFMLGQQSQGTPRSTNEPTPTVAGAGAISLVNPTIIEYYGEIRLKGVDSPLSTITQRIKHSLIQPTLVEFYGQSGGADINNPLPTLTGCNKHGLANPILVEYYGQSAAADIDEPLPTVTTKDRHGLVNPLLVEVNHRDKSTAPENGRIHSVEDPLPSPTTKRGVGLANPSLVELNHGNGPQDDRDNDRRVHSFEEPLRLITTVPGIALASPVLVQTSQTGGNGSYVRPTEQPVPTLTTRNDMGVATPTIRPYLVPNFGEHDGQEPRTHDVDAPLPTVTSRGSGSLVSPTLVKPILRQMEKADLDLRRLVFVDGQAYLLDIRFRMLQNAELARAMGFEDEETSYEFVGNVSEITKQIGNAVPVHLAAALVKAALDPGAENPES